MTDYVDMAIQALERPSDFGWFGRDDMFETWGITGPHWATNSGDVLDESNFHVFCKMAAEKFGTDDDEYGPNFDVVGIKHWAVGPMDSVITRIIREDADIVEVYTPGDGFVPLPSSEEQLTEEFIWLCDILIGLKENYPVLDDDDFSEREWEQNVQAFKDYMIPFEVDADFADEIIGELHNRDVYIDEATHAELEDEIYDAAYAVGADDRHFSDEEWQAWEFLNPGALHRRYVKKWAESGQLALGMGDAV